MRLRKMSDYEKEKRRSAVRKSLEETEFISRFFYWIKEFRRTSKNGREFFEKLEKLMMDYGIGIVYTADMNVEIFVAKVDRLWRQGSIEDFAQAVVNFMAFLYFAPDEVMDEEGGEHDFTYNEEGIFEGTSMISGLN